MKLIVEATPSDKIAYHVPDRTIELDPSKMYVLNIGKDGKWHVSTSPDISFDSYEEIKL